MTWGKGLPGFIAIGVCLAGGHLLFGEPAQQAKVTQVVNDVKLVPSQAAPRPAAVNDQVKQGTAVRTGSDSRTELTFSDLTITRLGANTLFSFKPATRDLNLVRGAVLIQVPPGAPEIRVLSSAVSAAISGGTAIFDATTGKFMVLEGVGRVWPTGHPELAVTVHAGEMVWLTPDGHISQPEPFDVNLVMETSLLITDFARLPNYDLIAQVIDEQQERAGAFPSPPDKSNEDIISLRNAASPSPSPSPTPSATASATPTPSPSPSGTPSKFGSPQTITSPAPYVIDATTTITTDPTITTNGQTDFGTIYRGQSMDGPFSTFAFGATSGFDTSSGFDAQITGSGAVFKFTALELTGNPTVNTTNGEISLGLVGVNAITSGAPGGALTFTGIKGFLLATVNGPITLGREVSFSGMNDFTAYARGAMSDLTLGSDVNATSNLRLYGQRDINVTSSVRAPQMSFVAGRDLNFSNLASSETITGDAGGVSLQAGNNITSQQQIQLGRLNASGSSQFNLTLNAGNDLTVGTDLLLSVVNSEATFGGGANIFVAAGGTLTTGGILDAAINNGNGGNLGTDALIQVAARNLNTGGDFGLTINNSLNGRILGNATIILNVPGPGSSGNVSIPGNALLQILSTGDSSSLNGGLISGSAAINLTAETFTAKSLNVVIDSSLGGGIDGSATISSNIGTLTTTGSATYAISLTPMVGRTANVAPKAAAATGAAIDFNGGNYQVGVGTGGTFRSTINGGDGSITFNAADVHADSIKVGSFGDNGVLRIGGGSFNANTQLKLYAGGSNGMIDFVANVTLNCAQLGPIIAASIVTIENGVTVMIQGAGGPASVFTDNANYSVSSGGNGSTTGMFGGNGAPTPSPLASAPPFDGPSAQSSTGSGRRSAIATRSPGSAPTGTPIGNAGGKKFIASSDPGNIQPGSRDGGAQHPSEVRVADTNQLIALMDNPATLATIDQRKRPAETKRSLLGRGEKSLAWVRSWFATGAKPALRSARATSPAISGPNDLHRRDPRYPR